MVEKYAPEEKDMLILDVAAGTGFVAEKVFIYIAILFHRGLGNFDTILSGA